jgi:hypothetical protein
MRQRLAPCWRSLSSSRRPRATAPLADLKPRGGDAVEVGAAAALADDDVDRAGVGGGGEADGVALGLDRGEVAGVKSGTARKEPPKGWRWLPPGIKTSMLEPMLAISPVTLAVAPRPSACMRITAATPMTMPSAVSDERIVLRRISRSAMTSTLQIMPSPPARSWARP